CFFALQMCARINQTIAHSVLERDPPLPASAARGRTGERIGRPCQLAGHGDRSVARQPLAPVLVTGAELLLDQQPAKARAVDEQLALDRRSAGKRDRPDQTTVTIELCLDDFA